MRILLDTHVVLWWLADSPRLGARLRSLIEDGANEVFVSSVSIAEISIKKKLGKLAAPDDLLGSLAEEGFRELPLLSSHAAAIGELPAHHKDPFDRMLVAQALVESITMASHDDMMKLYDIDTITG